MRKTPRLKKLLSFSPTCAFLLTFIFHLVVSPVSGADKYREMINCEASKSSCRQHLQNIDVILEVVPKPVKAMEELLFRITLAGDIPKSVSAPYIDLGMPGMNMGPNRVKLKSAGKNTFEGKGIIVRCPSGRTIWQATVTVPDIVKAKFIFDVIY